MAIDTANEGVLLLYIAGYAVLIFALATALFATRESLGRADSGVAFVADLVRVRLRWLIISFICCAAGLPPFYFFGCKLGLLALVLSAGSWSLALALVGLVFFSWAVYFSIIVRLLAPLSVGAAAPLRKARLTPVSALVCLSLLACCLLGLGLLDEAYLLVRWGLV